MSPAQSGYLSFAKYMRQGKARRRGLGLPPEGTGFWEASYESRFGRRADGTAMGSSDSSRVETLFEKTLNQTPAGPDAERVAVRSIIKDLEPLSVEIGVSKSAILRILRERFGYRGANR